MDNFNIIYKILKALERAMDYDEFDIDTVSAQRLKISENRLMKIWEMLCKEGFVEGVSIRYGVQDDVMVSVSNPRITLKGIEYLQDNSFMKREADLAKGIKDITPGL